MADWVSILVIRSCISSIIGGALFDVRQVPIAALIKGSIEDDRALMQNNSLFAELLKKVKIGMRHQQ